MPVITGSTRSKPPAHTKHNAAKGRNIDPGPFIGIVKNNIDPTRSGSLMVWIPELSAGADDQSSWRVVSYASPFYGETSYSVRDTSQNFDGGSPHSYGMWMVPPDVGVKVLCMFVNGDPARGYWFACVPNWQNMHMIPGISSGSFHGQGPEPLVNYNSDDPAAAGKVGDFYKLANVTDNTHKYQLQTWQRQGLLGDPVRGPGTSSAFRETPSRVFGISTPGPEIAIPNGPDPNAAELADLNIRSRQGGHQFVMDDGDVNGNSQLIRLRTSNGNMLLMNDSAGIIYLINSGGSAWFELDGSGNIRAFSQGKIEMHATAGFTFDTPGPFKVSASTIDLAATGAFKASGSTADLSGQMGVKVGGMMDLHLSGMKVHISGKMCVGITAMQHVDLKGSCITFNTTMPTQASPPSPASGGQGPTHEPFSGHANSNFSNPASSVSYAAASGVPAGAAGSYGASASFGLTASVPAYYGVQTNANGPIKFNPGFQGSLTGQGSNLGAAASYNVFDSNSVQYTNAALNLPISSNGFAVNVVDPNSINASVLSGLTQGEAQNNPGSISNLSLDPFAIGQVNGLNVYSSPEEGIAALTLLLDLIQSDGAKTIQDFVTSYVSKKGKVI